MSFKYSKIYKFGIIAIKTFKILEELNKINHIRMVKIMSLGLLIAILSAVYGIAVPWVISYSIIKKYGHKVNYVVAYDFIDMNLTKSEKLIILAIKLILVLIIFFFLFLAVKLILYNLSDVGYSIWF